MEFEGQKYHCYTNIDEYIIILIPILEKPNNLKVESSPPFF